MSSQQSSTPGLSPHISPAAAWALSLGTTIGWGSLVVTSNTYLIQAGPAGSITGLIVGAAIMLILARNYHYMMNAFPDAGGAYSYAKEMFGYDYGFLTSWFLVLTYAAVLWANITSLPLFARYFIGSIFRFGHLYTIFGYEVYAGEILLIYAALAVTILLLALSRRLTYYVNVFFAVILTVCITACFIGMMTHHGSSGMSYDPAFLQDRSALSQIIQIACISPWAFIGFENLSHCSEELTFPRTRVFRIFTTAILTATALYIFVFLLSVSAYPPEYSSWLEYIRDHGNLSGIKGLPAFYAAQYYMGQTGVTILITALFGLIITSLIGNSVALSRLFYSLSKDSVLPGQFTFINSGHVPSRALLLVAAVTLPIPFLGRTAIGWIVDVTTIGATLVYALVSASALKLARIRNDRTETATGWAGLIIMVLFEAYLLLPGLFTSSSMEKETFFLFVLWGILGFIFFRNILRRDKAKRFGKSLIVWIGLLSMVLLISLIWMSQSMMSSTNTAMENIRSYYISEGDVSSERAEDEAFIETQIRELRAANGRTIFVATGMFAFSLMILLTNYTYMNRRQRESEEALGQARAIAYNDPLTGVKNKRAFTDREKEMDEHIKAWNEASSDQESAAQAEPVPPFAVLVADLNGLKHINDTYGHKAGDEYIRSASRLICESFQHSPVYRIGGDEFVVLLSGRDYENRDSILSDFNSTVESNIGTDKVVVAAGISDYVPERDKTVHAVFERADNLMYTRKQQLKSMGARSR